MDYQIDEKFNALDRLEKWDKETQGVILKRLKEEIGDQEKFTYLTASEGRILKLLCDVLIDQTDSRNHIKIAQTIDSELSDKKTGVRLVGDKWRDEIYRDGLKNISLIFEKITGKSIEGAGNDDAAAFVQKIFENADQYFETEKFLRKVLSDAAAVYYSHPESWNKIGFPGPAYPEGYGYLECDKAEKWEPNYFEKNNE